MKNKHCFFTSFNKAYAAQALLLAESLRKVYGDAAHLVALLVDELDEDESGYFDVFDELLLAETLEIPQFRAWMFGHSVVEAATAVKPFAMQHLLTRFTQVTYLDPDTYVYAKLDEVTGPSGRWDITLTPHQTRPQADEWLAQATELESLRYGVYNLGFLSVRASAEGRRVAQWWADRCYLHCTEDLGRGMFTDQKIFDLAPALFAGVRVLRHPGYNVATWNLRERRLTLGADGPQSNAEPLRFCHFTKATHIGALALERMVEGENLFVELFHVYLARLRSKRHELAGLGTDWAWSCFADGSKIAAEQRKAFRAHEKRWDIEDPFEARAQVEALLRKAA